MNQGPRDTETFFTHLQKLWTHPFKRVRACLFPPFIDLKDALQRSSRFSPASPSAENAFAIGAQNAHWEKKGAFTGEISGPMLQEIGIQWVLVGHSERRQHFGETDRTVRLRAQSLLEQGFTVILCVGETREEREQNKTTNVLTRQVHEALGNSELGVSRFLNGQLILAYEPVWAIGTGLTATPEQAEESHQLIRCLIQDRMGEASHRTPILYGGSVTPENIDSLLICPNIDGALVGGASLQAESFFRLLAAGENILNSAH